MDTLCIIHTVYICILLCIWNWTCSFEYNVNAVEWNIPQSYKLTNGLYCGGRLCDFLTLTRIATHE